MGKNRISSNVRFSLTSQALAVVAQQFISMFYSYVLFMSLLYLYLFLLSNKIMFFQLKLSSKRKKKKAKKRVEVRRKSYLGWRSTCERCWGNKLCEFFRISCWFQKCFVFNFWMLSFVFLLHIFLNIFNEIKKKGGKSIRTRE